MDYFDGETLDDAVTTDEMRAAIFKAERNISLVVKISNHARHLGLSGEDKYTCLAYALLKENIELKNRLLSDAQNQARSNFVIRNNP